MLHTIWGPGMELREEELLRREQRNRKYMMDLKSENLLLNYNLEAGRYTAAFFPEGIHGGWEAQTCQLRGHFLGHWLSAAAMRYHASGDGEIKAKADAIVHQLALCQEENGGQWVGAIPEKYLYWIGRGKQVWAPQYNLHKILMGLVDQYELAGNQEALAVADRFADWFCQWSAGYTREQFDEAHRRGEVPHLAAALLPPAPVHPPAGGQGRADQYARQHHHPRGAGLCPRL